jgi:type I restriction enzyme S subunit
MNQAVLALAQNETKIYSEYLYYHLTFYVPKILAQLQGSGQPNLSKVIVDNSLIPFLPLPEQRRIASILSQVDEVIEKEQKYKEKLERIKRGLMEDLLTGRIRVNDLIEHSYIEN